MDGLLLLATTNTLIHPETLWAKLKLSPFLHGAFTQEQYFELAYIYLDYIATTRYILISRSTAGRYDK